MKVYTLHTILFLLASTFSIAKADVLAPKDADAICRNKAVHAAHFISETTKKFYGTYRSSDIAEISTKIVYEFRYDKNSKEALFTVVAYAYPDDRSCTIGAIFNNIAGND